MNKKLQEKKLPRLPKVLADEVASAFRGIESIGSENAFVLLARLRRNRMKCIATWGISNIGGPVPELEPIPLEHLFQIERLEEALQKLHRYNAGNAREYAAKNVERIINSYRASAKRSPAASSQRADIIRFVEKRNYAKSNNKKEIKLSAADHFCVSVRTVERAIKAGSISRTKRNSSDT